MYDSEVQGGSTNQEPVPGRRGPGCAGAYLQLVHVSQGVLRTEKALEARLRKRCTVFQEQHSLPPPLPSDLRERWSGTTDAIGPPPTPTPTFLLLIHSSSEAGLLQAGPWRTVRMALILNPFPYSHNLGPEIKEEKNFKSKHKNKSRVRLVWLSC